jgi:hypothetical protein
MSYITGLALCGIITTLLVVFQIKLTLFSVAILYIAITALTYRMNHVTGKLINIKKDALYVFCGCGAVIILTVLFYKYNFIHLSGDSYRYILIGHSIEEFGFFNRDYFGWEYAARRRMSFLPLIFAASKFFKIDFFYTFLPISAFTQVFLVPSIAYKLSRGFRGKKKVGYILCFLSGTTIASIPAYWWHAFYVSNNLLVSLYFTLSLAAVLIYCDEPNLDWLVISALFLGTTTLLRNEMTVFASIVLIILLSSKNLSAKTYLIFLCIFFGIGFTWHAYRVILLGIGRHAHGWGLVQLLLFTCFGVSFLIVYFENLRKFLSANIIKVYLFLLFTVSIIIFNIFPNEMIESLKYLLTIMSNPENNPLKGHNWSIFWIILSCFFVYDLLFIKSPKTLFLGGAIAIFLTYRVLLYGSPFLASGDGVLKSHFNSGSRILIHIFPTSVIYIYSLSIYAFNEKSFSKY